MTIDLFPLIRIKKLILMSITLPVKFESFRVTLSIVDILFRDDTFVEIIEFFTFKDLYNFFTKPISKQIVILLGRFNFEYLRKHIIRSQSYTFFRKFGLYNRKVMSCLGKINAVIAGGFALALFTGELHDSSDMNIFIPATKIKTFNNKIQKSGLKSYLLEKDYFQKKLIKINPDNSFYRSYYEFHHDGLKRKVKIIFITYDFRYQYSSKFGSWVIEKFDFTVVMCYIRKIVFKKTIFNDWGIKKNDRIQYNCFHLNDILDKRIEINLICVEYFDEENFKQQCFKRFIKYKSRKFELSNSMNLVLPMITNEFLEYESLVNNNSLGNVSNILIEYEVEKESEI